jgi:predicted transcriptional regulator
MKGMKCAEELMIPLDKYPHITYWTTLRETIAILENFQIEVNGKITIPRVALVFNEEYHLVGIIRRRDILRGIEPHFLKTKGFHYRKKLFDIDVDPNLSELSFDKLVKDLKGQARRPVKEFMHPIKLTVDHDNHVMKIIYELVATNVSIIPVLKDNKVIGVVRSVDCLHEISKLIL